MPEAHSPSSPPPPPPGPRPAPALGLLVSGASLLGFGAMMAVMTVTYARDLATLVAAPWELWSALCGQPVKSDLTMPALLATTLIALVAGAALLIVARLKRR